MASFIFDVRYASDEIQDNTPATIATVATKLSKTDEKSRLSQLSQPLPGENANSDLDAFEERAAIIEHDGGHPRQQAETLAAQEQGHADADNLYGETVKRWAVELERLAKLPAVSPDGAAALKSARAFVAEGWALQAVRLGWDEVEIFGVCPRRPWARLDRKGVAFGGAVQAVTEACVVYVGGLRRYRAQVNNDYGAVLIWEMTQDSSPTNGGDAA